MTYKSLPFIRLFISGLLFKEALVMTHCHLTLDFADGLDDNAYYDEHRRTAECDNAEQTARNYVQDKRYARHYAQEECAHERNLIEYLLDVERCGLAGTNAGNEAAVLHQVVGNLNRIERNRNIEISECDNEYQKQDYIEPAVCSESFLEPCSELAEFAACLNLCVLYECHYRYGKRNKCVCKDYRHNARHIELYRQVGILTAVNLSAHYALSILNRDSSLGIGHIDNEHDVSESDNDCKSCHYSDYPCSLLGALKGCHIGHNLLGKSGYDVGEEEDRDTVSDTLLIYLFAEPHNYRCTRNIASYDYDDTESIVVAFFNETVLVFHDEVITDTCDYGKNNSYISCYLVEFLSAVLTVLSESLQRGNSYSQKLNNDLRRDVGRYAEGKKCTLSECGTRKHAEICENACLAVSGTELAYICERYGDNRTYTVKYDDEKCEKYF